MAGFIGRAGVGSGYGDSIVHRCSECYAALPFARCLACPPNLPSPCPSPEIDLTVYPDECDAFGHLNQASFLSLFERARWEMLARGPGMDVFTRAGAWPAVRKTVIDYHAAAFPGDVLRFTRR